jgi:hypothetical protein
MENQNGETLIGGRWHYQKQEQAGDYWFSGKIYMTANVQAQIPNDELQAIILFLKMLVEQKKGLDYLQVFTTNDGTKIFVIDQITRQQIASSPPEYNHFTILFPHEY